MLSVLLLLFLFVSTNADNSIYEVICTDSDEKGLYLEPVPNVGGRFVLKWCTVANSSVDKWRLNMYYYESLTQEQCHINYTDAKNHFHSFFEEPVEVNSNCTNVCFTVTLDAIFGSTCYHISTYQVIDTIGTILRNEYYHYVRENQSFSIKNVTENIVTSFYQADGDNIILNWYTAIPASLYSVYIMESDEVKNCDRGEDLPSQSSSATTTRSRPDDLDYVKMPMNCSLVRSREVRCRARARDGPYSAQFQYDAPWISLRFATRTFTYLFCHRAPKSLVVYPGRETKWIEEWWGLVVGVAVAFLLGLLALLLLGALRSARGGAMQQNIRRSWLDVIAKRWERPREARAADRLLLLYARDCDHLERAAALLALLLHQATGCKVVDLYSPETVAEAAPAGGLWLRALLARSSTRVVLLQSPAMAMYRGRLADPDKDGSLTLEAPLLGGRVAWRRPHAADALLLLALRLLAGGAHTEPLPYKKYYVATVAGLEHEDVVPALTPQRRYALPDAAAALLEHLAPPGQPAAPRALQQLADALQQFRQYALHHPNYLFDDLMFQ